MFINGNLVKLVSMLTICTVFSANNNAKENPDQSASITNLLTVYKSAQCGCCGSWIKHMNSKGFHTIVSNQDKLSEIKKKYEIQPKLRSCHTTVAQDGYVFEGHIPAKYIQQFLDKKPEGSRGLAVPGMPVGTPGMEYKNKFMPYKIYLLKTDGSLDVFAEVKSAQEQF